jgi:hypothetical protein
MVESAVASLLGSISDLVSVVGTRMYPHVAPEAQTLAYLTYKLNASKAVKNLSGLSNLEKATFEATIYSFADADTKAGADALRNAFRTAANQTLGVFAIKWVWFEDESDDYILPQQATERGIYIARTELTVWYSRTDK